MPISFDDSEFAETPDDAVADAVDRELEGLTTAESRAEAARDPLELEVERRFEIARYYQHVLRNGLFEAEGDENAAMVETEIRGFVRERLELLMGVRQAQPKPAPAQFSAEEMMALKKLLKRLLGKPDLITAEPVPVKQPKPAPVLKKVPPAPEAPVRRGPGRPPKQQPPAPAKPAPAKPKKSEKREPKTFKGTPPPGEAHIGDVIEEDGHRFEIAEHLDGSPYRKLLDEQVRPPGYRPMASAQAQADAMAALAANQISILEQKGKIF